VSDSHSASQISEEIQAVHALLDWEVSSSNSTNLVTRHNEPTVSKECVIRASEYGQNHLLALSFDGVYDSYPLSPLPDVPSSPSFDSNPLRVNLEIPHHVTHSFTDSNKYETISSISFLSCKQFVYFQLQSSLQVVCCSHCVSCC
jgi:hypothetical protein